MHLLQVCLPLLLLLLGVPHSAPHRYVSLAGMAGSVQQAGQTLAAGLAANTQWFQPVGAGKQVSPLPISILTSIHTRSGCL